MYPLPAKSSILNRLRPGAPRVPSSNRPRQFHRAFGGRDAFAYAQLERRHDYIQWLFPSPERSAFNAESTPLGRAEARAMRQDPAVMARLRTSLELIRPPRPAPLRVSGGLRACHWRPRRVPA
jgi:hypothetical protein